MFEVKSLRQIGTIQNTMQYLYLKSLRQIGLVWIQVTGLILHGNS